MTGLLSTRGLQFRDWPAACRLFSQERISTEHLFSSVHRGVPDLLPEPAPLCLGWDDSLIRKTSETIHGAAWGHDPLGPKFQTNFIRTQRLLQFSTDVPAAADHADRARAQGTQ